MYPEAIHNRQNSSEFSIMPDSPVCILSGCQDHTVSNRSASVKQVKDSRRLLTPKPDATMTQLQTSGS